KEIHFHALGTPKEQIEGSHQQYIATAKSTAPPEIDEGHQAAKKRGRGKGIGKSIIRLPLRHPGKQRLGSGHPEVDSQNQQGKGLQHQAGFEVAQQRGTNGLANAHAGDTSKTGKGTKAAQSSSRLRRVL